MKIDDMFNSRREQPNQLSKDSLNKYKKKVQRKERPQVFTKESTQKTSKNQFQKYFLDTNNVFYEDRQTLKQLQETQIKIKIFTPIWFVLAITYMIVSRIGAYEGQCPQNATCKVFLRCNPGYELSQDGKHCVVKASIIEQVESVCKFQIENLKHEYGDADCLVNVTVTAVPYKHINELTSSITRQLNPRLTIEIEHKISSFLNNATNQATYDFDFRDGRVIPLSKKHSFSCWLSLASRTTEFKVTAIIFLLLTILSVWLYIAHKREQKVRQIYEYLRDKVVEENKVNITLLMDQIKMVFGKLDENVWIKIDEERKKDGRIGYFEDEFLYWKLL